jgi:hypothetical protein
LSSIEKKELVHIRSISFDYSEAESGIESYIVNVNGVSYTCNSIELIKKLKSLVGKKVTFELKGRRGFPKYEITNLIWQ